MQIFRLFSFSIILLLGFNAPSFSGTIQVLGKINLTGITQMPEIVVLRSYGSAFPKTLDTFSVNMTGNYEIKKEVEQPTLYYLAIGNQSYKILLHPNEKKFKCTNELNNKQNFTIEDSKENDAYKSFNESVSAFEKEFFEIIKNQKSTDSNNIVLKDLFSTYYNNLWKIKTTNPNSFVAKELSNMKMFDTLDKILAAKNIKEYSRKHYMDNVHFVNENLLREPTLNETLLGYLINVSDTSFESMQQLIDKVFEESKNSPKMFTYVVRQIFQHFIATNRETELAYLATKTLSDNRIKENLTLEAQMRDALRVTSGKPALEVNGLDIDGNNSPLSKLVVTKKVTLMVFWEPNCSHCREAMPELKTLYDKYEKQGLGIYGVNMGEDTTKWVEMIKTEKLNWTNIMMQKKSGEKMSASLYYVLGTPTFVLIDRGGKIIRRFIGQSALESEIKKHL